MNFANVVKVVSTSPDYVFDGPQFAVQSTVAGSAARSAILDIPAPHANSSWSLDFVGPALSCKNVDADMYTNITDNIFTVLNATNCQLSFGYLAWTTSVSTNGPLPFTDGNYTLQSSPFPDSPAGGLGPIYASDEYDNADQPLSLYVAALPNMIYTFGGPTPCGISARQQVTDATVVECILQNASYTANFSFVDSVQSVQVERQQVYNNVSYLDGVAGAIFLNATDANYTIIPGQFNTSMVATFAYEAVMTMFNSLLLGGISMQYYGAEVINTSVAMTPLIQTKVPERSIHPFPTAPDSVRANLVVTAGVGVSI